MPSLGTAVACKWLTPAILRLGLWYGIVNAEVDKPLASPTTAAGAESADAPDGSLHMPVCWCPSSTWYAYVHATGARISCFRSDKAALCCGAACIRLRIGIHT